MTKTKFLTDGVWYDLAFLPTHNTKDGEHNHLIDHTYDIIVKEYDASTDEFVFSRKADCSIIINEAAKPRYNDPTPLSYRWADRNGAAISTKNTRIVAFMIHPDWKTEGYDARLTKVIAGTPDA